jgi:hypothetical protein
MVMAKKNPGVFLGVACSVFLSGCAPNIQHGWIMRGQILSATDDDVTICVGRRDGAAIGDEFDVQHITVVPGPPKGSPSFKRTDAGRVRIVDLFNEHYARAHVLRGSPAVNDVVELQR